MKKLISALLSSIIAMSTMTVPAIAGENIKVTLNGQEIQFDVQPQIINERTMVPVRVIFEALGASVEWDQTTQTVTSKKGDITISLSIDNTTMMVNNKKVELDQPACIIDERTLVPVRAISEAYGTTVDWDQANKTVLITTSDYVAPPVVYYDDISANVNQIKDMIGRGLYIEAIQECENAKNWHKLSPEDTSIINEFQTEARVKYDEYLKAEEERKANISTDSKYSHVRDALNKCKRYVSYLYYEGATLEISVDLYRTTGKTNYLRDVIEGVNDIYDYFDKIENICGNVRELYPLVRSVQYDKPVITSSNMAAAKTAASRAKLIITVYNSSCDFYGGEKVNVK